MKSLLLTAGGEEQVADQTWCCNWPIEKSYWEYEAARTRHLWDQQETWHCEHRELQIQISEYIEILVFLFAVHFSFHRELDMEDDET